MIENQTQMTADQQHVAETFGSIDATLAERGRRYGAFPEHARITQAIKRAMQDSPNWAGLSDDKKEALEMVAHKVGRILNGDPEYRDSWRDIVGYSKLVEDEIAKRQSGIAGPPVAADRPEASVPPANWIWGAHDERCKNCVRSLTFPPEVCSLCGPEAVVGYPNWEPMVRQFNPTTRKMEPLVAHVNPLDDPQATNREMVDYIMTFYDAPTATANSPSSQ